MTTDRTMLAILLLTVLVAGCSIERPANPPADPPPGSDLVEAAAIEAWSAALNAHLTDPPPVLWFEGTCLEYDGGCDAQESDGATVFVPGDIEIHLIAYPHASQSALAHELLHWSLHETGHGWDGDHTEDEWELVEPLQEELAEEGL